MDKKEIKKLAKEKIKKYVKLTDKAYLRSTDLKYVKIIENREKPGEVKLKKAWVVRFIDDGKYKDAWVELVLDENGEILKFDQSR